MQFWLTVHSCIVVKRYNSVILLFRRHILRTYSTAQSPAWEANRFSANQEIPAFYGTWRFITLVTSFDCFATWYVFRARSYYHAQPLSRRTTPCRLPATAYSVYSQVPSILEAVLPSATWGRTMPCWYGPTYHGKTPYLISDCISL